MAEEKKETKGSEGQKQQEGQASSRFPSEVVTEENMTKIGESRLPDEPESEPGEKEETGGEEGKKEPEKEAEKEKEEEAAASKKKEEEEKAGKKGEDEEVPKGIEKRFAKYTKERAEEKKLVEKLIDKLDVLTTAMALGKVKPPEGGGEEEAAVEETPEPKEGDFDDFSDYQQAVRKWDREQIKKEVREDMKKIQKERDEKAAQEVADRELNEKLKPGREKYKDFDEVIEQELFTPAMQEAIFSSGQAAEIAYHLGKNTEEAERIAGISNPIAAAREIGKLEAALASSSKSESTNSTETKEEEKASLAPEPVEPISGAETVEKSLDDMSHAEFDAEMTRREKAQKT